MPDLGDTLLQMAPPDRRRAGPYELEAVLGSGGMGVVYRGRAPDGRAVAVKVLRTLVTEGDLVRRFEREARVRIDHPNVVQVLDAGADTDGAPYIVFELVEGESLVTHLARGGLSFRAIRDLGVQVCAGLSAAHALGIVHRDLKPANLVVGPDGTVKLLDFGIALLLDRETRLTAEGGVVGTPAYLAPEQASGLAELDARVDLWALGVMLFEAITGRPPFERDSALATILAIVREDPPPLRELAPAIPPALADVIERALRKPRDERWSSARDLGEALSALDPAPVELVGHASRAVTRVPGGEQRVVAVLLATGVRDLDLIDRAVTTRGGVLVPLVGERAIGLFGGETWEGDEVSRAVQAALEARPAAASLAVSSGRAMLRGAAISGAALRSAEEGCAATLDGVAIDPDAARALTGSFALERRADRLFEVLLATAATEATSAADDRPILGRDAELAQMRQAIDHVLDDHRSLAVLVSGPVGIGKSRLIRAARRLLTEADPPFEVVAGRAEPAGRGVALSLFGALLRGRTRARAAARTGAAAVLEMTREALGDGDEECASFLGVLMGVAMPESEALRIARSDPQLMADRLRLALQDYFEALGRKGPLALVLEDLQWSDPTSLDVIGDLLDRLSDAPFLVFATARPELLDTRPDLLGGKELVQIVPRGLSSSDAGELARRIAGQGLPDALARAIAERAGGNPLFVEQMVVELRDRGLLDADPSALPLPLTIEAAVQSRLDHLPAAEKDLCKRASVLGRPFSSEEVEALGVTDATPLLRSLQRRDLVGTRRRARQSGSEYHFRSALVGEVAYRMFADDQRTELHRRAAALLRRAADADAEEVASHHERGGEPAAAAERYAAAALVASRRGDGRMVLRCSDRALALGVPAESLFALHRARAEALAYLGRLHDQSRALEEAIAVSTGPSERAELLGRLAAGLAREGLPDRALATAEAAIAAARTSGEPEILALALGHRASALISAGKVVEARVALGEATQLASSASVQVQALVADKRGELAGLQGDLGRRRDEFLSAVDLYRKAGDLRRAAHAEQNLADVYNRVGAYSDAEVALRKSLEGCRRLGQRLTEGYALANLGYSLGMQGRAQEALAVLEEAGALSKSAGNAFLNIVVRIYRARALLGASRGDEAASDARAAAREAETAGLPGPCALALSVSARAALMDGRLTEAHEHSSKAMALLDQLGGLEEDEAEVILGHARVQRALGDRAGSALTVERGRARIAEIAAGISDGEWRRRFLDDIAAHRELRSSEP